VSAPAQSFWSLLPLGSGVKLLAHDANGLAAFNKPAGVLSHPNVTGEEHRSLLHARYMMDGEYFEWPAGEGGGVRHRLWLLNRLDSATSGVILAAADAELAAEIRAQFKRKQVRKTYHALVFGVPRQSVEIWRDRLAVRKRGGQIRTTASQGNVPAECRMALVRANRNPPRLALVRLEPRTGRSHQLRVQCARRGLPIVGDQTYGDFAANRAFAKMAQARRMFLHSSQTVFSYAFGNREHAFSAEAGLPPEFEQFL
jgi:tRNA pseudouridine65 synthase